MRCACTIPHKQSTDKYNFETCITFGTTISARRSQIAEPQLAHLGPDKRMCAKTHHLSKCMCAFVRVSARACVRVLEQVEYVCVICGVVVRTNISPPQKPSDQATVCSWVCVGLQERIFHCACGIDSADNFLCAQFTHSQLMCACV